MKYLQVFKEYDQHSGLDCPLLCLAWGQLQSSSPFCTFLNDRVEACKYIFRVIIDVSVFLDRDIRKLNSKMIFMHGDTVKTLDKLHKKLKFGSIYSHEDNTPFADKRDAAVRKWADSRGVEFQQLFDYDLYDYREGLKDNRPLSRQLLTTRQPQHALIAGLAHCLHAVQLTILQCNIC